MKIYFIGVIILITAVVFSSCQREIDGGLERVTNDSTIHVISTFRVVETDVASFPQDSIIRIIKTIMKNGEKSVIVSEVYPPVLNDTFIVFFKYNPQGQLISIKESSSLQPTVILANTTFTWNSNRLVKMVIDTMGVFEGSVDYTYTSSGANTVITSVESPSSDFISPDNFYKTKHKVTVNAQFLPVEEWWATHSYIFQGGLGENIHDTAKLYFSYSGNDLNSASIFSSRHDTSGAGGSVTKIERDTGLYTYARSNGGTNIADSMRKIYGNVIYTMAHMNLMNPYAIFSNLGISANEFHFFSRPLSNYLVSKKVWINGIFEPSQTLTNENLKKIANSFDAQQRLIRSDVYLDPNGPDLEKVIRVYY